MTDAPPAPPALALSPDAVADHLDEAVPLPVEGEPDADREGLALLSVGGARLAWETPDGDTITVRLRRPLFGEIREVEDSLQRLRDEVNDGGEELRAWGVAHQATLDAIPRDDPDRPAKVAALRDEDRVKGREFTDRRERLTLQWWLDVIAMLGTDKGLQIPEDTLPAWLADPLIPRRLLNHYKRVPTVRG